MKITQQELEGIIKEEISAVMNERIEADKEGAKYLSGAFQELEGYALQAISEISTALDKIHGEITPAAAVELVMNGAEGADNGGLPKLMQDGIESVGREDMEQFEDFFQPGLVNRLLDLGYDFASSPPDDKIELMKKLMEIMTVIKTFLEEMRRGVDLGIYKVNSSQA